MSSTPRTLKKGEIKDYIAVTKTNWPVVNVVGRILHVIVSNNYYGSFVIEPCFTAGWWMCPVPIGAKCKDTHIKVRFEKDVDEEHWAKTYKGLIIGHMEEGKLFIKQSDPILEFKKV